MTLQELNELIDKAITGAEIRPAAMDATNILNAEYALGAIHAYLDIIYKVHGLDSFVEGYDRVQAAVEDLTRRTQTLYERRTA